MSRTFIAIVPKNLSENTALKLLLGKLKRTLKDRGIEARWTQPDLWHVTLQFLGELSPVQTGRLLQLINGWKPNASDLRLSLKGLGGFPSSEAARVLWMGVQENQQFLRLQKELGALLMAEGFKIETREFHPHLSLARLRNTQAVADLVALGGRKFFGEYAVEEVVVFESVLQGQIIKYVPRLRHRLSGN